jgi:hypothetical protein
MIGYSDHGVGYLDPDRYDMNVQFLIEEEQRLEEFIDDREEDILFFLEIAFNNKDVTYDLRRNLNEIFSD